MAHAVRLSLRPILFAFLTSAIFVSVARGADKPEPSLPHEMEYDFRGSKPLPPGIILAGALDGAATQPESSGFRITIVGDQPVPIDRAGLEINTTLKGDFEITAGYELLRADQPKEGYGVGFELFVHPAEAPQQGVFQGLGIYRVARVEQPNIYMLSHNHIKNGKPAYDQAYFPTNVRVGKLRISRSGAKATASAAEGTDGPFKELRSYPLGSDDISVIWLMAFAGHSKSALDLRVTDVKIRASAPIPSLEWTNAREANATGALPRRFGLYAAAGLLILLLLATAVLAFLRRRASSHSGNGTAA
ncbi:MAG TPA: hypothetical protein VGY58_20720 [Gemmataceae bacterium]|nr:hypothetical protein [Gemmataceae bacterium]